MAMYGLILVALLAPVFPMQVHDQHSSSVAPYLWPSARGRVGQYSASPYPGVPQVATNLAWSWHHSKGRFYTITLGTLLDDQSNVYLAADDGIRKFDKEGHLLWTYTPPSNPLMNFGKIPTNPSIYQGQLFGSTKNGRIFALSMETGKPAWTTRVSREINGDSGFVGAYGGVIVAASDAKDGANRKIRGLRARDGSKLWEFTPDAPVWNFMPSFVDDRSFVFQDVEGRAYNLKLQSGKKIWKSGGLPGSATDGTALLGENGIMYAVTLHGNMFSNMTADTPGSLTAYKLSNGKALWFQTVPRPPNVFPGVGRLKANANLSVVLPVGQHCAKSQNDVYAFDAQTGTPQWKWEGPFNAAGYCAGDMEGLQLRKTLGIRNMCLPNTWGAPSIDGDGVVYVGNQNGQFYTIKDLNNDGIIDSKTEVSSYDTGAALSNPGSSHGPGMVAVASCDSLFVFKDNTI